MTMVWSDAQLIERCLAGETEAFNGLVGKWQKRIYNFTLRYCGSREDAQDLSQEIFTTAFQRLGDLKDHRRFAPWLYKIALNRCYMRHRSSRGRENISLDGPEGAGYLKQGESASPSGSPADPESALQKSEKAMLVRGAMSRIPDEQRVVILLKEYQGLKFQEIADILDCPLSTVKSRLYMGFRAMRKVLEEQGINP